MTYREVRSFGTQDTFKIESRSEYLLFANSDILLRSFIHMPCEVRSPGTQNTFKIGQHRNLNVKMTCSKSLALAVSTSSDAIFIFLEVQEEVRTVAVPYLYYRPWLIESRAAKASTVASISGQAQQHLCLGWQRRLLLLEHRNSNNSLLLASSSRHQGNNGRTKIKTLVCCSNRPWIELRHVRVSLYGTCCCKLLLETTMHCRWMLYVKRLPTMSSFNLVFVLAVCPISTTVGNCLDSQHSIVY